MLQHPFLDIRVEAGLGPVHLEPFIGPEGWGETVKLHKFEEHAHSSLF